MILRDPVHGLITFESDEEKIITRLLATSEVQRLRRIRQLGLSSLVFHGAEHTRFAHAIGTAHVMKLFLARLRQLDADLPFWQRVTSDRARDALAAALLHDVGHGPFSHLFEDAMPGAIHHEGWTESILLDPSSEVHRVLISADPYLPKRVAELVRGEHELPYLAKVVSGTFDVDRCDYLLRDAHATGARYGEYDLAWLLRSLRLSDSPADEAQAPIAKSTKNASSACPTLALDGTKGLSAIESFLLARHFMFQQVYFHKAARAAEWMVGAILRRAIELVQNGMPLPALPAAFASAASGEAPSLGEYLELDDQVLLLAMHAWENSKDALLSDLCKRVRARALFKAIELFPDQNGASDDESTHKSHAAALETAREIARQAGLDPHVYVGLDIAEDAPYADDDSLKVVFPKGRARSPAEVSFLLARLRGQSVTRARIIFAPELRSAMREALIH